MWNSFIELSNLSMGVIPVLVVLFTVALAVIIERLYFFHRVLSQGAAMEHDLKLVAYRAVDELRRVVTKFPGALQTGLVTMALSSQAESAEAAERHIDETILEVVPVMDRNLWVLDTAVTLGPLLGLLGTIFGMIKTFDVLGAQGMGAGAGAVTGGIGEALVATGVGLFIAIVGLIFLNHFNKRVRLGVQQMELIKITVVNRLHGGGTA
ncbi:MAG: MotA/TolQ/ExbB proton channel family protein [Burkholderiales bacterium]|jgi:biopolymer transport protein ExbB|nr:MotA/TolQ/ExbB proton channel family protein [Burkholderiales bacterium]